MERHDCKLKGDSPAGRLRPTCYAWEAVNDKEIQ